MNRPGAIHLRARHHAEIERGVPTGNDPSDLAERHAKLSIGIRRSKMRQITPVS
ncbi:hypothetical protein [Mycobacterium sp.]|uniref:hypothetical protein n=1 Tax=Mycobacterium sp. TaxID=1785 RepID=UPI003A84D45F